MPGYWSTYKATIDFGPLTMVVSGEVNMKHIEDKGRDSVAQEGLERAFPNADFIFIEWIDE